MAVLLFDLFYDRNVVYCAIYNNIILHYIKTILFYINNIQRYNLYLKFFHRHFVIKFNNYSFVLRYWQSWHHRKIDTRAGATHLIVARNSFGEHWETINCLTSDRYLYCLAEYRSYRLGAGKLTAIYSFIIDGDPKFENQAKVFLSTLLHTGVEPHHIVAHATPSASSHAKAVVSSFGVEIVPLEPFLDEKYCNKLVQIESIIVRDANFYILCDTDLAFVDGIEALFDSKQVRAKPVDLPNPPLDRLEVLKQLVAVEGEPRVVRTSCDEAETWSVNCNGGLYIIPADLASILAEKWKFYANKLIHHSDILEGWYSHIDQIAFALAMISLGQDVREIPVEYNFPLHLESKLRMINFSEPKVLHYHWLLNEDGNIKYTGHPIVDISVANANLIISNQIMPITAPNDIIDFCKKEQARIAIADRSLYLMATKKAALVVTDRAFSVPVIFDRVKHALDSNIGLSLIRVGNGEGNAVSMVNKMLNDHIVDMFFVEFLSQNGIRIGLKEAIAFCCAVARSILDADIIGFRSFYGNEEALIESSIQDNNAYAALGISYAREFLYDCLMNDIFLEKTLTSAWVHLDAIPHFDELLSFSDRIIVISGRSELRVEFEKRLGHRLKKFIAVPVQGHLPTNEEDSHYGGIFRKVIADLNEDLRGHLILVGAGLFGKIYCYEAKRNGGVALDLGSAFDVLGGHQTRPVFSRYEFDHVKWI